MSQARALADGTLDVPGSMNWTRGMTKARTATGSPASPDPPRPPFPLRPR